MNLKIRLLLVISLLLILVISGCSLGKEGLGEEITIDEAKTIALEDAPRFKPNNNNFEIWKTEKTDQGWIIMISSGEPKHREPSPNIYYKISRSGNIIERENMALGE
ncbi:hypothetical protein [Oceanobacillus damuensis]|uniref:hypothetical protein n=1 Tax=Oceanobacillus damuensis TaxID=937928 RepID=UPI000A5D235A|nr:hypothetical protein [Oceanobacillus damuensis]